MPSVSVIRCEPVIGRGHEHTVTARAMVTARVVVIIIGQVLRWTALLYVCVLDYTTKDLASSVSTTESRDTTHTHSDIIRHDCE